MKYTLLLIVFTLFLVRPVYAAQFAFSQSPQAHEVIARPGATVILPFTLTNVGDPTVMELRVYTVLVKDSQGSYALIPHYSDNPNSPEFYLNDSTHLLSEPFFINTSEAIEYEVAIHIPEGIREGDYYFAVVGQSAQNKGFVDTSTMFFQGGVGSMVYLTVSSDGVLHQSGSITQFDVQSKHIFTWHNKKYHVFDSFKNIPFVLSIANAGSNLFKAAGTISIRPIFLGTDAQLLSTDPTYVMAETNKILRSSQSSNRNNTVIIQSPFAGIFGASSDVHIEEVSYIVFPFTYIAYGVGMVFLIATIVIFLRRINGG